MNTNQQDEERFFHNRRIDSEHRPRLGYAYKSVADVFLFTTDVSLPAEARILELGCFKGENAEHFIGKVRSYVGLDISEAAVSHCENRGIFPPEFSFVVDDASSMRTQEGKGFDYAFGSGVVHHLHLDAFCRALQTRLKEDGFARFVEPAHGNFILRLFRMWTPGLRTSQEWPIDDRAVNILQRYFEVTISRHGLVRPALPMLFANSRAVTQFASWIDRRLERVRILRSQFWLLQIELRHKR